MGRSWAEWRGIMWLASALTIALRVFNWVANFSVDSQSLRALDCLAMLLSILTELDDLFWETAFLWFG
jgi:hypothetical protein